MLPNKKIIIFRHALFDESIFPFAFNQSGNSTPNCTNAPVALTSPPIIIFPISSNSNTNQGDHQHTSPAHTQSTSTSSEHQTQPVSPNTFSIVPLIVELPYMSNVLPPLVDSNVMQPPTPRGHHMITRSKAKASIHRPEAHLTLVATDFEPASVAEALENPDWKGAMQNEYNVLLKLKTWILSPLPAGKNLIDCKWVFNIKRHANGSIF